MRAAAAKGAHLEALVNLLGVAPRADVRGIVALDAQERVRGGILYEGWTASGVQAHMAAETPIAWRCLLRPAFAYPFVECGRRSISGYIAERNRSSRRMAKRLGFAEVARIRDGHAVDDDWIVVVMHRELCPWLDATERRAA